LASEIYDSRRLRSHYLSESLLGEPVWDMLLALYCAAAKGERVSVSALCHAAAVPSTTGLRWLQLLEQKKLVERCKDHLDGRRFWVRLSDRSHATMTDYLTALIRRTARNRARLQACQQGAVTE
jgi:DNA-binding MarR family transcriptional regulator